MRIVIELISDHLKPHHVEQVEDFLVDAWSTVGIWADPRNGTLTDPPADINDVEVNVYVPRGEVE